MKKEARHILSGAPNGIASCNVAGQTLYSMWNLQVEHAHKSEYRSLSQKNRMKANYICACAHLIDEVYMGSNQMLMHMNMRMMDVLESQDLFGGLLLMEFGHLFQLEPVNAASKQNLKRLPIFSSSSSHPFLVIL